MKAVRVYAFGDPDVLQVEDVDDPVPGPGQVVVAVRAAGVNPVDTYIRSGTYALKPDLPYTPGQDGAGIVEGAGEGVVRVQAGDRVYVAGSLSGTYAEKALCREDQVHPMPEEVSFAQGAGVGIPCAAAYYGLFLRACALPEEALLVHGATGGVGLAAVQLAAAAGLTVMGTGGTPEGRDLARACGADHVLDHRDPDHGREVLDLTRGRGADVILEMAADRNLGADLGLLAPEGRVVVVGSRGAVEINPRDAMVRNASILGMLLFNATDVESARIHAALGAALHRGTLRPVVGREFPLTSAPEAHRLVLEPGALGKIVLIP